MHTEAKLLSLDQRGKIQLLFFMYNHKNPGNVQMVAKRNNIEQNCIYFTHIIEI